MFSCFLFALVCVTWTRGIHAESWDCSASSGVHVQWVDCTMAKEVVVDGDLQITGRESSCSKIVASIGDRHFSILAGSPTLTLKWLNLTGGRVVGVHGKGGSVNVGAGAILRIENSVFFHNYAEECGGAINVDHNMALVSVLETEFVENRAAWGGAIFIEEGSLSGLDLSTLGPTETITVNHTLVLSCVPHKMGICTKIFKGFIDDTSVNSLNDDSLPTDTKSFQNERSSYRKISASSLPKGMQIGIDQVKAVLEKLPTDGDLLVWGLGHDSKFWREQTTGRVVFLENHEEWLKKITALNPDLEVYRVQYNTTVAKSFPHYSKHPERWPELDLRGQLPTSVSGQHWDVILVDAPQGYCDKCPGRCASIWTAAKLSSTNLFLDDLGRHLEFHMSHEMLGEPDGVYVREHGKLMGHFIRGEQANIAVQHLPRTLHFVWMQRNLLEDQLVSKKEVESAQNIRKIQALNPEYEVRLYDDEACALECQNAGVAGLYELYCDVQTWSRRGPPAWAKMARVCQLALLYNHGGVYMNVSVEVGTPISKFLDPSAKYLPATSICGANQEGLFSISGSLPRHSYLFHSMELMVKLWDNSSGEFEGLSEYCSGL